MTRWVGPRLRRLGDVGLAVAAVAAGWEALSVGLGSPALPPPREAVWALATELRGPMGRHLLVSLARIGCGLAAALGIGLPLGLYLGRQERGDRPGDRPSLLARLLLPVIYLTYPVPKVVLLPVVVVLMGVGELPKLFLIGLVAVYQVVVSARDAAREVSPQAVLAVSSLGASEAAIYRHVILPAALPKVFTALRISLGTAVAVLFFAETFATTRGAGFYVVDMLSRLNYPSMFAGILAMGLMGFGLYWLIDWLEAIACPWVER